VPDMNNLFQSGDWTKEKHVPVIGIDGTPSKGSAIRVTLAVGREIPHPNTTEHHIAWIELYFLPAGEKFPSLLGRFDFAAHGASVQGPNTGTVYTVPETVCVVTTEKTGTLIAASFCNIHGLWQNTIELAYT